MFTDNMPKIVGGYFKLLEAVEEHFKSTYTLELLSRQGERALIFKNTDGASLLYFGMRWELWDRMHMPLWLGMRPEWGAEAVDAFAARHQGRSFMHEGYRVSPLDPNIATDNDNAPAVIACLERELAAAGQAG